MPVWFVSRWWVLSAAILVQCSAGLTYCFGIYSEDLQQTFRFTENQTAALGFYANLGGYLGIVAGIVYDLLATTLPRLGPRLVLLVGALLNAVGYYGLNLGATGRWNFGFAGTAALLFIGNNAGTWIDTAALVTCVSNFPNNRGYVVGLLKSFVGLSGAIYTVQYEAFFAPDSARFLRFVAIAVTSFAAAAALLMNRVPPGASDARIKRLRELGVPDSVDDARRFSVAFVSAVLLVAFLCTASLLDGLDGALKRHAKTLIAACSPLVLAPAFLTALTAESLFVRSASGAAHAGTNDAEAAHGSSSAQASREWDPATPLLEAPSRDYERRVGAAVLSNGTDTGERREEVSLTQAVLRLDFWLLFIACFVGMGAGLVYINGIGQYAPSLGASRKIKDVFVAIISVGNALGRLLGGALSQMALTRSRAPRTLWLTACAIAATALNLFLATNDSVGILYPVSLVEGLLFGAHWSLMPSITSELFGLRYFASIYCTMQLAAALGSFAMAKQMTAALYNLDDHHETDCVGVQCYSRIFLANAALCFMGVLITAGLVFHTRFAYRRIADEAVRAARGVL